MCPRDVELRELAHLVAVQPKVTPDPSAAKYLKEQLARVEPPQNGFLRDQTQDAKVVALRQHRAADVRTKRSKVGRTARRGW